ncbi:MAG: glycosyltransferase [Leptolyngbyaceae bacterium]|nr:glycosyltransferase [Leptolyngbyaceae bacterium]
MKILIVTPSLGPVFGGPTKVVLDLAQALTERTVSVDIVATNANGSGNLEIPLCQWITTKPYRIQYFPRWNIKDYTISLSLTAWLFRHVADYDLVHTHTIFAYPVLPAEWACQRYKVATIRTPHGMLEPWSLAYKAAKKRLYYALLEKPLLQRAGALHALNSSEAKNIQNLRLQNPVAIVSNGIHRHEFEVLPDPAIFYQRFPATQGKQLILFLARIDPKKGLDLLAPAFAKVQNQFPETHLVIAGSDDIGFLPTAQGYFAQAGCLNHVTFTGILTGQLKQAALAAASAYVLPSYSEGFSMSVLEAMASGLPCVITTGCNFPEAATAQAAHVVDISADAIAHALIECFRHPEQAKAMGDRARELVFTQYEWNHIAAQMVEVYTTAIKDAAVAKS